jgi:uncharacterized phage-associated protein
MIEHFIILYSDYKSGRRIAFHKSDKDIMGLFNVTRLMEKLKEEFKHLSFGFHHLQTADYSWDSVMKYDKFFSDVTPIHEFEQFKFSILEDQKVSALDVANLMTAHLKCTHLKLQKLLYLFYCKYTNKYRVKPFDEDFYAWQYGPVIKEVYDKYKIYGRNAINVEDDTQPIDKEKLFKLSVSSRFMKTPLHQMILDVLEETLTEFGHLDAFQLVDITHVQGGPWDRIYRHGLGRDEKIPHSLIEDYCITESVTYVN